MSLELIGKRRPHFPHICGPLNVEAVIEALAFDTEADGRFYFPKELVDWL
jgi:uncharacterized protein (DUF952 family)